MIETLKKHFLADRLKEINSKELAKEMFYLECNPEFINYFKNVKKELAGQKIPNTNNSTIAYLMGISDEKPNDLGVSKTPTTLPDIDYDTDGRDEIKSYLTNKYGAEHVTLLGTYSTLKTKGAIKDVIRQLKPLMNFEEVNELTKKFDAVKRTDSELIEKILNDSGKDYSFVEPYSSEIAYFYACLENDPAVKAWFTENKDITDAVTQLLGNAKTTGIHAGGIVVSSVDVTRSIPVTYSTDEKLFVTQPEMAYVEESGLVKYDFLGLKTLRDINLCFKLIKERHNKSLKLRDIPLDDQKVLDQFAKGNTPSVFQFNTGLAVSILVKLKSVDSINDLAIITSIARPGPLAMGMDEEFVKRKNGEEPIKYLHPLLEPILKETYGITCIAEGSLVLTKKGLVPIEKVQIGSRVKTENGTWQKVLANLDKGNKKTIRIRTNNGQELVCTADHKVLTQKGWKEAGELNSEDNIKSFDLGSEDHYWSSVLSLEEDDVRKVYDLSIDKVHSFVVGGLVVHNCYQEQVMQSVQSLGGLTGDESVTVLKGMGKKQLDKILKYKDKFLKHAVNEKGLTQNKAEEIWEYLQAFAEYGFNRSHAIAYSCVSYICMYLKEYYSAEWIAAVLSGADKEDFKIYYQHWKQLIQAPDVNKSKSQYIITDDNKVIMPLSDVNGVGTKAVESIVETQPYTSFEDFFARVDKRKVTKTSIVNLIFSGCFDSLKPNKHYSPNIWRKEKIVEFYALRDKIKKSSGEEKRETEALLKEVNEMSRGQMMMKEISLLNFTSFNYYDYYHEQMTSGALKMYGSEAIKPSQVGEMPKNKVVVVGGAVESILVFPIKNGPSKGQEMARIVLSNEDGSCEITVFAKTLKLSKDKIKKIKEYTPLIVKGKINHWNNKVSVVFEECWILI